MAKSIARMAVLIALALALAAVERLLPAPVPVPGAKLGLANLATVVALYVLGAKQALCIGVVRVVLAGFLFGAWASTLYALSGAVAAFAVMALMKQSGAFGVVGASVAGGVAHNMAQCAVAAAAVGTAELLYYAPLLVFFGVAAGLLNGLAAHWLIARLRFLLKHGHTER
jgi:heptaprenyl diphosphate synthase